jgi:two-component system OmpR family response regulator
MYKATILCVDDDRNLQSVLQNYLEDDGYRYIPAFNGRETEERLLSASIDVVLLDLTLPDTEGFSLISFIKQHSSARIIIVSGKTETTEKIIGLEMGADDYLTKPFEMRELSARIKAVMRRKGDDNDTQQNNAGGKNAQRVFFEGWCLDRTQYQLFDENMLSANLTIGEFRLLEALVMAPHRALTREFLYELTRDNDNYDSYDRAIDIQIARIRKKMNDDPRMGAMIKTVRGVGYMFCADTQTPQH